MLNIQMATFVSNEKQVFAALMALASIKAHNLEMSPVRVLMPKPVLEDFSEKYPNFNLKHIIRVLGGEVKLGFKDGYNWNLGFRPALSNFARGIESDSQKILQKPKGLLYFSPKMVFFDKNFTKLCDDKPWAARQPDDFWPERELYGPSLTEMWTSVVELGDGKLEDWIDPEFPEEYWRRYPAASPAFFYAPHPAAFANAFGQINDALISSPPSSLDGQGHAPIEPILSATIVKTEGELIHPEWNLSVMHYQDFYDLLLRMDDEQSDWFEKNCVKHNAVRALMKSVPELKIIFFSNRIINRREKLDGIERNFSILRMQQLIDRRNIRRSVHKKLKEDNLPAIS